MALRTTPVYGLRDTAAQRGVERAAVHPLPLAALLATSIKELTMMKLPLILASIAILSLSACKKTEPDVAPGPGLAKPTETAPPTVTPAPVPAPLPSTPAEAPHADPATTPANPASAPSEPK